MSHSQDSNRWYAKPVATVTIIFASLLIGTLLAEGLCRIALSPVDFLTPKLIPSERYGVRIQPGSAEHDSWGFRNKNRPDQVDIIALGDSQTYGISAPANRSWPSQLSALTNRPIYNMGLIGGGPKEYWHLVQDHVGSLQPKILIIGSYLGNDLLEASLLNAAPDQVKPAHTPRFHGLRKWLGHHSVLYKLLTYTVLEPVKFLLSSGEPNPDHAQLLSSSPPFKTILTPKHRLQALNRNTPQVRRGYEIMQQRYKDIFRFCNNNGIRPIVVVIPTKELVLAPFIPRTIQHADQLTQLIADETFFRNQWIQFLRQQGVTVIDALPQLRSTATQTLPYPSNHDGHPNDKGYKAIATSIQPRL